MNHLDVFGKIFKPGFIKKGIGLFLVLPTALLLVNSCEQTISNPELPYEVKLVVSARLGDSSATAYVSRTLPLTQKYSEDIALVRDAHITLTSPDGSQTEMTFDSTTKHYGIQNTNIQSGKSYSIKVEWHGLIATASTIVPPDPEWEVDTVILADTTIDSDPNNYPRDKYRATIKLKINPLENIIYRADCFCYSSSDTSDTFSRRFMQRAYIGKYEVGTDDYLPIAFIYSEEPVKAVLINIYSSTSAFDDYDTSLRNRDDGGGNIFGSFGTNPKFNVYGDGIGVFDGYTTGTKKVLVRLE